MSDRWKYYDASFDTDNPPAQVNGLNKSDPSVCSAAKILRMDTGHMTWCFGQLRK